MSTDDKQPIPQGKYLPASRHNDIVYTSGMTPRRDGVLIYAGKIEAEKPIEEYKEALRLAAKNALLSAQATLQKDEKIDKILQLTIYLNTQESFKKHPKIADFASALLVEKLGIEAIGSRITIGVSSLPSNAPAEIALVATIR